jgi:hypothetical protein
MTGCMSTTRSDTLDSWLTELTGGESSMRRLRKKLGVESTLTDPCPTCQRPPTEDVAHTGHV